MSQPKNRQDLIEEEYEKELINVRQHMEYADARELLEDENALKTIDDFLLNYPNKDEVGLWLSNAVFDIKEDLPYMSTNDTVWILEKRAKELNLCGTDFLRFFKES